MLQRWAALTIGCALAAWAPRAQAWGDEGHQIVALIAQQYLEARVKLRVEALLATDDSGLVPDRSMASEATWADRYRDADRDASRRQYEQTRQWHYVDIELDAPNLDQACFGHPGLGPATPASAGPAAACVIDKIEQFGVELRDPGTSPDERRLALQFLLHLIADLHQPLHASDDRDQGGNLKRVSARGMPAGNLHHYWDTEFVRRQGRDPRSVSQGLLARISSSDIEAWRRGDPADWARESFSLARSVSYDALPRADRRGDYRLSAAYVREAVDTVQLQLSRAGVRLAMVLNRSLRQ
ncbi:MAG: S1/P1 nuclease [Steroidobacterales bacterium]